MSSETSAPRLSRRGFLALAGYGLTAAGLAGLGLAAPARAATPITLPALPFAESALDPYISARTISFHYSRHHAGYVNKVNAALEGSPLAGDDLEDIIRQSASDPALSGLFNNAAQVWNHTFFWNSMKPGGGGTPSGDLAGRIDADFGNLEEFKKAFAQAASSQFGSGWAWLVEAGGKLMVTKTANADTPLVHDQNALLTLDVWEHAYYLDYQNRRGDYINAWLDHLVNWDFAAARLG